MCAPETMLQVFVSNFLTINEYYDLTRFNETTETSSEDV